MAFAGTGTGPFTITGVETTLSIFNYVAAANAANATKNSDNSMFDFNCPLNVGDGSIATLWNPQEEHIRIDASEFRIRANAELRLGLAGPARTGCYLRVNCPDDAFSIDGTFRGYASRIYSNLRVRANTGAVVYLEECAGAFLDSIDNMGSKPNIQYVRCNFAGAAAVAVKLGGTVALSGCKVSGAQFAYQPLPVTGQNPVYTVNEHVGEGNTNDVVPNSATSSTIQLNIDGAYELTAGVLVPRTGLISTMHVNGYTVRLRWKYNLNSATGGAGASGVNVRIRNVNNTTVFSGQTAAGGSIAEQRFPRVELINNATNIPRFPYSVKARRFNLSSEELIWQCENHTSDKLAHTVKAFAPASEAAGLAFTGIALVASGANGGTLTVTEPRITTEIWQYFCAWIAQHANHDSNDTWAFTGETLNTGAWNVVRNSIITGSVTTTGTITGTGSITGTAIDANSVGVINVLLTSLTDTVEMRKASDSSLVATRTGAGGFAVSPANVGVSVYFERRTGSNLVMSTITTPVTLTAGVNPDVPLYAGAEVQVAQAGRIEILPTLSEMTAGGIALQSTLTTLASTNQTEHDATQAAITAIPAAPSAATITSAVRADLERTGGMLDVLPTLAEMEGSAKLSNGGIIDLGVFTSYEGTAGIPYNAYSATFPKRLGLSYGTGLTARLYSEGQGFSSAAQVTDSDTNNNYLNVNIQNVNDFGNYIDSAPILIIFNGTTVNSPIVAKGVFIPGGPSLRDMEQSTVLAKEATVASRASQSSVTALGSPLQSSSYVAPDNTSIAAIKTKTDTLVNGPTLAQIEGSTVLAKATAVSAIPTNPLLATDVRLNNLDATVSSRLASSAYVAAPTLSSIRADIERTGGMLDAVPTLAEIEASAVLAKQSGFTGLATTANVTAAQTAIVAEVNQNETKIDAVKADTAAIKAKTDTLVTAPTAAQIRTELEMVGGKLDTTLKTAKKVRIQTL